MPGGFLAVDFFFALSGFIIWKNYAERLRLGELGIAAFMQVRLIRLYPIFALGILFGAAFALQGILRHTAGNMGWMMFVPSLGLNLAMLPSPVTRELYPINFPAWSLFYELLVNLLLAAVLVRLRARTLVGVLILAGIGLLLTGYEFASLNGGAQWQSVPIAALRTIFSFTLGLTIAYFDPGHERRNSVLALVCFAALCAVMKFDPGPTCLPLEIMAVFVISPTLLFACSRIEPLAMAIPAAAMLGEVSYALYAVHPPVVYAAQFVARRLDLSLRDLVVPYVAVALALAWVCTRFLDPPMRRMLNREFARVTRAM